VVGLELKKT